MNEMLERIYLKKLEFHKKEAAKPFEEKMADMIELQKIDIEFSKYRNQKQTPGINNIKSVWKLD